MRGLLVPRLMQDWRHVMVQPKTKQAGHYNIDYLKNVPIRDVCEILGIEVTKDDWFLCPSHNDTKPSAKLYERTNTWHCMSCHAGRSTIDLVMAAKGLTMNGAAQFLAGYYPEADLSGNMEEMTRHRPRLPKEFYEEIGLGKNPYTNDGVFIKYPDPAQVAKYTPQERARLGDRIYEKVTLNVEEWVTTDMIIGKIMDTQQELIERGKRLRNEEAMRALEDAMDQNPDLPYEEGMKIYQKAFSESVAWQSATERFQKFSEIKGEFSRYYDYLGKFVPAEYKAQYEGEEEEKSEGQDAKGRSEDPERE